MPKNSLITGPGPTRPGLAVLVVTLLALWVGAPAEGRAQEPDADTRMTRPTTTRPATQPADVPTVRLASPRPVVLKIGSSYSGLTLTGANLDRVTVAFALKPDGQVEHGFDVKIIKRNRTDTRLALSLIAGKPVAPGDYRVRLSYELDSPLPQSTPTAPQRKPVIRSVDLPAGTVLIRATAMNAAITSITPESPQLGKEYGLSALRTVVSQLPGKEVVSVTRWTPRNDLRYCDFEGTYHSPEESLQWSWQSAHNLEIRLSPGRLVPIGVAPGGSAACRLRFSLGTKNELGESFYTLVDKLISFQPAEVDPRRAYAVANTWELDKYLKFKFEPTSAVGACGGSSGGTSGLIPVGFLQEGNDVTLRIRSGPIGTKCTWMVYATRLNPGWELRMNFEKQQVGDKCDTSIGLSTGESFRFTRTAGLYHRDGVLTLSVNNPRGEIPPYAIDEAAKHFRYISLRCAPTLTNDHGVTMKMVSAELFGNGGQNCTWKCGVAD